MWSLLKARLFAGPSSSLLSIDTVLIFRYVLNTII